MLPGNKIEKDNSPQKSKYLSVTLYLEHKAVVWSSGYCL